MLFVLLCQLINLFLFFFFLNAFYQRQQKFRGKLRNKPDHTHTVQQGYAGSYICPTENLVPILLKILNSEQTNQTTGSTGPLQQAILLHPLIL